MKAIVYLVAPFAGSRPRPFVVHVPPRCTPANCWQHEERHHIAGRRYCFTITAGTIHETINNRAHYLAGTGASGRRATPPHYVYPDFCVSDHRVRRAIARHHRRHPHPAIARPILIAA